MKRILDLLFSLLFLIIFSPILIIISIIIKIDSKGPVFFKQRRIGKDKEEFLIYKFRTMYVNTPELATDKFTNAASYITKIGSFLRKTSLDELPQILNIIKGEMSFVGPRPALYNQYELIEMRDKKGVNKCVPGLTGYAQVNGRDNVTDEEKTALDEYYVQNQSLALDFKIIINTFVNVLLKKDITN